MTLFRTSHQKNYTVVNNTILADKSLSWKAKGIWLYAMSRPDNWTFHLDDIIAHSTDGREAVRSGIKELMEAGYLIKQSQEKNDQGRWGNVEWVFYETPQEIKIISPHTENPLTENPLTGELSSDNRPLINTEETSTEKEKAKAYCPDQKKLDPEKIEFDFSSCQFLGISHEDMSNWKKLYPLVNIENESLRMIEWIKDNRNRCSKRTKWRTFINNWFAREQQKEFNRQPFKKIDQKPSNSSSAAVPEWKAIQVRVHDFCANVAQFCESDQCELKVEADQVTFVYLTGQHLPLSVKFSAPGAEEKIKEEIRKRNFKKKR